MKKLQKLTKTIQFVDDPLFKVTTKLRCMLYMQSVSEHYIKKYILSKLNSKYILNINYKFNLTRCK